MATHIVGRHVIAVGVEPDEGCLVDGDRHDEIRLGHWVGEREQAGTLLREHVGDASVGPARMRALKGDGLEELEELGVAVRDRVERARREEAVLEVPDRALDLPLVRRPARRAEGGLDVQSSGEIKEGRIEADRVTRALDNDALGVVEEPLAG
jgi:hypothetical protein